MKYQVTFFVKINGKIEAIVVKTNALTENLAVAQATLKYTRMFPVERNGWGVEEIKVKTMEAILSK